MNKESQLERKTKHVPILRGDNVIGKTDSRNSKEYIRDAALILYNVAIIGSVAGLIFYGCSRIL